MTYKYYELLCGKLARSVSIISGQSLYGISAANPKTFIIKASSMPDFTEANLLFRKQVRLLNCDRIYGIKMLRDSQVNENFSKDEIEKCLFTMNFIPNILDRIENRNIIYVKRKIGEY